MEEKSLSKEGFIELIRALLEKHVQIVAPAADNSGYCAVHAADQVELNPAAAPADLSFKRYVFPVAEVLFHYKKSQEKTELVDAPAPDRPTVIFGAKPCDAASVNILQKVFNWDYKDEFFDQRAANAVIIGLACHYRDAYCFCESVGLSPASETGSDLFLTPVGDGFQVRAVSEKGIKFVEENKSFFTSPSKGAIKQAAENAKTFAAEKLPNKIGQVFEHPIWKTVGEACLGCGRCAFVCPTCHCFDIVDEDDSYESGKRMKNWDACQFGLFTLHASGHNPRETQPKRIRQRVAHKFKYYPERFSAILCTGCGRCSRGCPVGIDLQQILTALDALTVEVTNE
jgi:ferredoxin